MKRNININQAYHEVLNEKYKLWEMMRNERYKEYREKWSNNPINFVIEESPLHLDIELTSACNLKCPMCPRTVLVEDDYTNFNINMMNLDLYKKIINEAADIGVYSVKLNWLGEPLMHRDIIEMVKYAKDKGIEDVMLNTNAVLLDNDMSKGLIEAQLDKLFFSFDSPVKEKYEAIRVGANYNKTLDNIKNFIELRNTMGMASPITRVSMVLMENNKSEYEEFIELFKDIADEIAYVDYLPPVSEGIDFEYNDNFVCSQLWQRMVITADGEALVCCPDIYREYVVGNVNRDSILEIWKNEKIEKIRQVHMKGNYNKIPMCAKCNLSKNMEKNKLNQED